MWTPGKRGEAFLAYTIIIILMIISKQFLQVDIWTQIDFVHVQPLNFGQNLNQLLLLEKKKKMARQQEARLLDRSELLFLFTHLQITYLKIKSQTMA